MGQLLLGQLELGLVLLSSYLPGFTSFPALPTYPFQAADFSHKQQGMAELEWDKNCFK